MPDIDQVIKDYTRQMQPGLKVEPGVTITRDIPTRKPELGADVAAPVLIVFVTAFVVFVSVGGFALIFGWPVAVPFGAGCATLFLFWMGHVAKGWDRLLWAFEEITGMDVDKDGQIGPPPEITITVQNESDDNSLHYLHIPERLWPKLPIVAQRLIEGTPFSEGALCGKGRPLSRTEFHQLRDIFFNRGVCEWQDPEHHTLGIQFTPYGRSVIRQLAELTTTPARIRTPRTPDALPAHTGEGRGDG